MEEMQNVNAETTTEMVEVITDKLTFKDNLIAYGLAATFIVGVGTISYLAAKGSFKLLNKIREERKSKVVIDQEETVDESDEQEHDNVE